ncbi:MAG: glycosyltransferase, partial [Clostridium sp.]|nr:glycosyltransferase [Clostridium sp.]
MCKVSIIVAVYQGELYIKECLESLLLQDLDDYEIICINDGSTDYTEMIILEMQKSFSKIRYIYQKNSGVSVARNKGLEQAAGDYVMFVDADDYLKNNS